MSKQATRFYEFDSFRLDLRERQLLRDGEIVILTPKVFETLLVLIESSGQVLEKEVLMKRLWPDSFVEESNLAQNISLLRKALREGDSRLQYIETIPKRGYRFNAVIHEVADHIEAAPCKRTEISELISANRKAEEVKTDGSFTCAATRKGLERKGRRWQAYALLGFVTVLTATLIYMWREQTDNRAATGLSSRSIAILPFKTVGAEKEKELLGLGMADTLIIKLSKLQKLQVLPTSSVYKYSASEQGALSIGRELGTDVVLDGTVQRSGERVRVSAQLLSTVDGTTLWAGKFDEKFTDIFEVHDLISEQLARALTRHLTRRDREELLKRYTLDADAYEAYITGVYFWNKRTEAALTKAIHYFERAVEKDPSYALAFAMLSDTYFLSFTNGYNILPAEEARAKHVDHAKRALELDATLAEAHMVMAFVKDAQGDYRAVESEYQTVLEINPSYSVARLRYSYFLLKSLQLDKALEQMRMARELDPVSPTANAALCYMSTISRQADDAIKYCRRALELDPEVIDGHLNLGEAYMQKGLYDDAVNEFEKMPKDGPLPRLQIAYAHAMAGRRNEAHKILSRLQNSSDAAHAPAYNYALLFTALGNNDKAFEQLAGLKLNRFKIAMLKLDPQLDPLRADPRFTSFLQSKGLEYLLDDK